METGARYTLVGLFTLAAIAAVFAFVYWLHNAGSIGERTAYQVRFEGGVSGLRPGSSVLFNGMKVGEVTAMALSPDDFGAVLATIAVEAGTPVRADTQVAVETQGMLGSPNVVLRGGATNAPALQAEGGRLPVLVAGAEASQDVMTAVRTVLRRVDGILAENAVPLRDTIANLKTFTDMLARNSDRLDGIVAGLEKMTGGGQPAKPAAVFDLSAPRDLPAADPAPTAQLVIADPTAVVALETQRLLTASPAGETGAIPEAQWSDTLPRLVQARVLQSFENAGLKTVSRPFDVLEVDYQLAIDLRAFRIVSGDTATAEVEFGARLIDKDGKIRDTRQFRATAPATSASEAPAAVAALNQAFAATMRELVPWTLGQL